MTRTMSDGSTFTDTIARLVRLLDEQIVALREIAAAFRRRPDAQAQAGYLSGWFPSRTDALALHRPRIARAARYTVR